MAMKVLVCGGRDFVDGWSLFDKLTELNPSIVVHGGALGADNLGGGWAENRGIPVRVYKANWSKHGKSAGFIRNVEMLESENPDLILACPGGKGTEHMVREAERRGYRVIRLEASQDA